MVISVWNGPFAIETFIRWLTACLSICPSVHPSIQSASNSCGGLTMGQVTPPPRVLGGSWEWAKHTPSITVSP